MYWSTACTYSSMFDTVVQANLFTMRTARRVAYHEDLYPKCEAET